MEKIELKVGDWVECPDFVLDSPTIVPFFAQFTPGKLYRVEKVSDLVTEGSGNFFCIREDGGKETSCNINQDMYIGGEDWKIVSYEKNLKKILE